MPLLLLAQRSESVRQTSSSWYATLQPYYSRPEASSSRRQHHAREAAHPRCIRAYNPSPRIGRAAGADACTPTTAPTITNRHEKNIQPSLQCSCVSFVVVLAAVACDSVVTACACCHRLPISVPDHHHAATLLFCSGSAAGIDVGTWYVVTDPILNCV